MAVAIEKHIMVQGFYGSTNSTSYAGISGERYTHRSSEFSPATYYIEYYFRSTNSASTAYLVLSDSSNNNVSGSELSTTSTGYVRSRSSAITLTNNETYKTRGKVSNGSYYVTNKGSRLVIVQSDSTIDATATYHRLIGDGLSGTDTNYVKSSRPVYAYWESGDYDGSVNIYLDATLRTSDGNYTTYCELYNDTDSTSVSGSEISTTSTAATVVRSGSLTLTDSKNYTVRAKSSGATYYVYTAHLVVTQTGSISKTVALLYGVTQYVSKTSTTYAWLDHRFEFNTNNWDGATFAYYHDATFRSNSGSYTAYSVLSSSSNYGEVSTNSWSYTRLRSSSFNLTTTEDFQPRIKVTSGGTVYITGDSLLIKVTDIPTGAATGYMTTNTKYWGN